MRSYQVGIEYYFRELGQKVPAGSVIELRQGDAERYMVSHPGLLKPLPMTTQARPQAVRSEPEEVKLEEPAPAEDVKPKEPAAPVEAAAEAASAPADEKPDAKPARKARAKK